MMAKIIVEAGDSITFGKDYCEKKGYHHLINQTVKMTPQVFEDDNGLYSYSVYAPGIKIVYSEDPEDFDAESIYHLFGNNFENLLDCVVIKGNEKDKEEYFSIIKAIEKEEEDAWSEFMKTPEFQKQYEELFTKKDGH